MKSRQRKPDAEYHYSINGFQRPEVKVEPADSSAAVRSIIGGLTGVVQRERVVAARFAGLNEDNKLGTMPTVNKPRVRSHFVGATHHETLQRIGLQDECNYYQQHWFSAGLEVQGARLRGQCL